MSNINTQQQKKNTDFGRTTGQAESTYAGYTAALKLFDKFQQSREDPTFAQITMEDIENDYLEHTLATFAAWMANTSIADATKKSNMITADTKLKYLGKVKEAFKVKFKEHEKWKEDESWYRDMKNGFYKEAKRLQLQGNDELYKDRSTRAIYKDISSIHDRVQLQRVKDRLNNDSFVQDLFGVCRELIKTASVSAGSSGRNFQERAWLILTFLSVGRGGEIKFLRYDEMWWDAYFQCPDATWTEMKTLKQSSMLYGPDSASYMCDFYHSLGCFYLVEDGLFRLGRGRTIDKYVFPDLHKYQNSSVAKLLSNILKKHTADSLKKSTSVKGLRIGSTTTMAAHPSVTLVEQISRGGWSSGSKTDVYTESVPALNLPGLLALLGWKDPHALVYPPRLECLDYDTLLAVERFIEEAFVVSMDRFKDGGDLHLLLRTCTASLIMYFCPMMKDFGSCNAAVSKMISAATTAKIGDDPVKTLARWSKVLQDDFHGRNLQKSQKPNNDAQIERLNNHVSELKREITERKAKEQSMICTMMSMEAKLNEALKLLRQYHNDLTPSPKKRKIQESQQLQDNLTTSPAATNVMLDLNNNLKFGALGEATAESSKSVTVTAIIEYLHQSGQLKRKDYHEVDFTTTKLVHLTEYDKYLGVMKLLQEVWKSKEAYDTKGNKKILPLSDLEKAILIDSTSRADDIKSVARRMEELAMIRMMQLEDQNKPNDGQRKKSRHKPFYIGLGARYNKHKEKTSSNQGSIESFFKK